MSNPNNINPEWNTIKEGEHFWGYLSPDKIGFRVHGHILNLDNAIRFAGKGKVSVTRAGGDYWDICVHAEGLIPGYPLISQLAHWFGALALEATFRWDIGLIILAIVRDGVGPDQLGNVVLFQEVLKWLGFVWTELEVAEDFPQHNRPIKRLDKSVGHKFRTTLYSDDGVQYKRKYTDENGIERIESKGRRKDMICEYNRARKIASPDPLWRVELRLQRHHLQRLTPYDLCLDFHRWVVFRRDRLEQFVRKAVKPGAWAVVACGRI